MDLLVFLLILLLVLALISWVISMIPMPPEMRNGIWIVLVIIAILVALRQFGYV